MCQSSVQNSAGNRGSLSWTTLQAKLSDNTLEKQLCNLFSTNSPAPKVQAVKTVYFDKQSTQVKMALQPLAQEANPVMKSIDQDPNLLVAIGNGSSNPGGACVLSLAH